MVNILLSNCANNESWCSNVFGSLWPYFGNKRDVAKQVNQCHAMKYHFLWAPNLDI